MGGVCGGGEGCGFGVGEEELGGGGWEGDVCEVGGELGGGVGWSGGGF